MDEGHPQQEDRLVTIGEAAKILGVSIPTLRRWEKKGLIRSVREGSGYRYFLLSELEQFRQSRPLTISEASAELGVTPALLRRFESEGYILPQRGWSFWVSRVASVYESNVPCIFVRF